MNKFLSSFTNSVSKEEVLQIIEDTSVTYNEDKSVSINDSKNTTIYTLPTTAGVPGNSVVVGPDGNSLIFANSGGGGVQNPMTSNLNCNNFFVTSCAGVVAPLNATMFIAAANIDFERSNLIDINQIQGITVNNRTTLRVMGDLLINDNIDMLAHPMFNILDLRSVDALKLDLMPSTQGLPNQVLSRNPAFDPNNANTHKLTWQTLSSGGVNNPMTSNLNGGNFTITNLSSLTSSEINVSSINLASGTIIQTAPLAINTQLKVNNINTLTNPTIVMPSVDFSGVIKTNTINAYSGTTIGLTSPTINITGSTAINLTGPTITTGNATFQSNVRTNTIDTYSGGNISCLQNLTLADGKQLKSSIMFSNSLRANTADLIIAGLLPDNKTQSNILISSPIITLNNQFSTLNPGATVNIEGTVNFINAGKINNVSGLTCYTSSPSPVNLNLDIIPSTEGTAGQVLTRNPAFNPANPLTHKLVWTTPATGVTNPLSDNLNCANYDIENARKITVGEIDGPFSNILIFKRLLCYDGINTDNKSIYNVGSIINQSAGSNLLISSPSINLQGTTIQLTGSLNSIYGITEHFNTVKMVNNDIVDVKDLQFNTGFIIPSSMGPGTKDQILTTDGKNAKWEYGYKIPYKIWDGANILPITTTPQDLSASITNKFRGTNTFPAGYFAMGDTLKIKFNGYVDFSGSGNNIISIFLNGVQHVTFTCQSATSGGAGISAYSADITLVAQIASNLTFSWSTCVYNQNRTGQNPVPPQCMVGSQVSAGSPLNVANTISVRFSQSVNGGNLIKVLSMVYEIY